MTLNYLEEQIKDELNGAKNYIEKAIEVKPTNYMWSRCFARMADMEADHAGNLMRMFEDMIRSMKSSNEHEPVNATAATVKPEEMYKNLMKEFGETMTYVANMKRGL